MNFLLQPFIILIKKLIQIMLLKNKANLCIRHFYEMDERMKIIPTLCEIEMKVLALHFFLPSVMVFV